MTFFSQIFEQLTQVPVSGTPHKHWAVKICQFLVFMLSETVELSEGYILLLIVKVDILYLYEMRLSKTEKIDKEISIFSWITGTILKIVIQNTQI
ncbi:MAG: hypothetical protein D3923_17090, partial [Candidatus Electrothrix sp. AR3]|nr:hypothetical protein [Candidatus Electrothrix sp. AR3]